jgi:copper(I)-binding protein
MPITVLAAVAVTGCNDNHGENSSHARGSEGNIGAVTVQNAYLVPALLPGTCVIQYEAPAELAFTATNNALEPDRLTAIESPAAGSIQLRAGPEQLVIPADGALAAGQPVAQPERPGSEESITVQVNQLQDWVKPGRNLDIRFTFDRAGTLELAVPVDSCPTQQTP